MGATSGMLRSILKKCNLDATQLEDAYPCTSLQAGLIAASMQGLADYTSRFVFRLSSTGHDPARVQSAVEAVFDETPILRTRFIEQKGKLLQIVVRGKLSWLNHDDIEEYLKADQKHAVTLGQPVSRFGWIKSQDGQTYMVWTLHHAQYDEWSFDLLLDCVSEYAQAETVKSHLLDFVSFKKFVKSVNVMNEASSHSFWETQLQHLSADRKSWLNEGSKYPATSKQSAKTFDLTIPSDCSYRPALLALAAWSIVNAIITPSHDVLFGSIVNGRTENFPGIEKVAGPTITTVPWRVRLRPQSTILEFLDGLSKTQLDMLPFEQAGLDAYRSIAGYSGFDTLLSVQAPRERTESKTAHLLRPDSSRAASLSHTCCIFFDVEFHPGRCGIKASYDDLRLSENEMNDISDLFIAVIKDLAVAGDGTLETLMADHKVPGLKKSHEVVNGSLDTTPANDAAHSIDKTIEVDEEIVGEVREIIMEISKLRDIAMVSPKSNMMELGIDSLKTMILGRKLSYTYNIVVPFKHIAGGRKTVLEVARCIQEVQSGTSTGTAISLIEEAEKHNRVLSMADLPVYRPKSNTSGASLLLTGANGYLGIEILRLCLQKHQGDIIAAMRCSDQASGISRLEESARLAKWSEKEMSNILRVKIWPCDLTKPNLGLSVENWNLLKDSEKGLNLVGIIHNAAKVNFLQTYKDLEQVNVTSTTDLLSVTLRRADAPSFVYVTGGRPCPIQDNEDPSATSRTLSEAAGYPQTKFVGELLVRKANSLVAQTPNRPCTAIVHPGLIIGSQDTGVASSDDFVWRYVAASILMGCYVALVPVKREWMTVVSVNSVASTIVASVLRTSDSENGIETHYTRSGLCVSDFWSTVISALDDIELEEVSEQEWLVELEDSIEALQEEHPLFSLSDMMLSGHLKGIGSVSPTTLPTSDVSDALKEAIRSNVRYLRSVGFFKDIGPQTSQPMFGRSKF